MKQLEMFDMQKDDRVEKLRQWMISQKFMNRFSASIGHPNIREIQEIARLFRVSDGRVYDIYVERKDEEEDEED